MLRYSEAYGWPSTKDVDFQFSVHEQLTANVERLLTGQTQHAINCLDSAVDPERVVHACRLATKRIDAVLLLLGNGQRVKVLREQTKLLRKRLSKYRDTTVLREHVAELPTSKSRRRALVHVDAKRADLYADFSRNAEPVVLERLQRILSMVKKLAVANSFTTLAPGLEQTYAKARNGVAELDSSLPKVAKHLHRWRAQVKRHGYHLELLMPCAPLTIEPRLLAVNYMGQCLGEYHDLELTRHAVSKPKVRRRLEAQQRALLVDALALQRWAMQPKPKKLVHELEQRWDLWHQASA